MDRPDDTAPPTTDLSGCVPDLMALNNAHWQELSLLDAARFGQLLACAFYAGRIGPADAFMLAFDQSSEYDSPNFQWFKSRYPRFVYVDRVVVAVSARGRGLAARLYAELERRAAASGQTIMACEVNVEPPNPASDRFHARLGFREIGQAAIHGGAKTVRYLVRPIAP